MAAFSSSFPTHASPTQGAVNSVKSETKWNPSFVDSVWPASFMYCADLVGILSDSVSEGIMNMSSGLEERVVM